MTGFTVNENNIQVWSTREKTGEELTRDLKSAAINALVKSDAVALRCIKAGVAFPAEWQAYVLALRHVVNGVTAELPTAPDFPAGT